MAKAKQSAKSAFMEEDDPPVAASGKKSPFDDDEDEDDAPAKPAPKAAAPKKGGKGAVAFDLDSEDETEEAGEEEGFEEIGAADDGEEDADPETEAPKASKKFPRAEMDPANPLAYKPAAPLEKIPAAIHDCFGLILAQGPVCDPESEECQACAEMENCIKVCKANKKAGNITASQKESGKEAPKKAAPAEAPKPAAKPAPAAAKPKAASPFDDDDEPAEAPAPAAKAGAIAIPKELGELHPQVQVLARLFVSFGSANEGQKVTFDATDKAFWVLFNGAKRIRIGKKQTDAFNVKVVAKKLPAAFDAEEWEKQEGEDGAAHWGYTGSRKDIAVKLRKFLGI